MSLGEIILTDALAEVVRLKGELEQARTAAKTFEALWHNAEKICDDLSAENTRLKVENENLRRAKLWATRNLSEDDIHP